MVHLQENGYQVEKVDVSNDELTRIKEERGIAREIASCHTAEIGKYFVEGHVPAEVIEKMLVEEPELAGLAVPGMPPGSPGMGGTLTEPLEILAFDESGEIWVYVEYMDGILE